ncbi:MAG: xanthine dehydrogenase family protein subunit M [Verrucomicrobia bacterium]|nr:xanthine dehydrogenase family protein subunit M [Verrucomicrobiota bacterium]
MQPFLYSSCKSVEQATSEYRPGSAFIAGGTNLVDLMKLEVMKPTNVLDVNQIPLKGITVQADGLHLGALEKMSDVAKHPAVISNYPVISQALLKSASAQLRNMGTMGGNLMQRTRCGYFRDVSTACNKRDPGSGCSAIPGENRMHAIFGTSESCIATHPSDLAVALVALDSLLRLQGRQGERVIKLADFYLLPGDTPDREHDLRPGELITEIIVPQSPAARHSIYVKVRDRESYEFALTSAAVGLHLDGEIIRRAHLAVGGVGTKPWSLPKVCAALEGKPSNLSSYMEAAALATEGAIPYKDNGFKIQLVQRTIVRALISLKDQV